MTLFYYFYKKYHRSIINSIEVSLNLYKALSINTKLQSTRYRKPQRKLQIAYLNIVPKIATYNGHSMPNAWATSAHHLGCRCPALGLPMPTTWSLRDHLTGTDRPSNGLISICSCLDSYHIPS